MATPRRLLSRRFAETFSQCRRTTGRSNRLGGVRYYAAEKKPAGEKEAVKDFKGQLYQSTHERLQREREEQARFSRYRESQNPERGRGVLIIPIALLVGTVGGYLIARTKPGDPDPYSTLPLSRKSPPQHDVSLGNLQAAWSDFKSIVGEDNISTQKSDVESHAGSEWSSYAVQPGDIPFAVVKPGSTEEVSEIMKVCHRRKIPVTGYSGGTSLEGHFAATQGGICVDFSRMDKILTLHKEDLDVVVQPAVGWELLNEELAEHGLFFPPDPGPGAMIGGMVGTGCSGTNAYRYGTMKDWVLSLTIVLADGTIIKTKQRPRKSSAGYDLTRMFIGSEGTLGLVTEATLKVTPKPQNTNVAVCTFPSVRTAADCVFRVVNAGIPIAAVEILDDVQMRCINQVGSTTRTWSEKPTLFFKFAGTPTSVKEHITLVKSLAAKSGSQTFEFARNQDEQAELWSARKEALWSVMAQRKTPTDHVWTTDVAVPISRLPDIIEETKSDLDKSGLVGSIVGHVGDGNFHAIILYNEGEHAVAEAVVHKMVRRAIEMEGTATGEHGVGLIKRDYLPMELGAGAVDLMRKMKEAFDPLCLLNCDKIVRAVQPKAGEVQEW